MPGAQCQPQGQASESALADWQRELTEHAQAKKAGRKTLAREMRILAEVEMSMGLQSQRQASSAHHHFPAQPSALPPASWRPPPNTDALPPGPNQTPSHYPGHVVTLVGQPHHLHRTPVLPGPVMDPRMSYGPPRNAHRQDGFQREAIGLAPPLTNVATSHPRSTQPMPLPTSFQFTPLPVASPMGAPLVSDMSAFTSGLYDWPAAFHSHPQEFADHWGAAGRIHLSPYHGCQFEGVSAKPQLPQSMTYPHGSHGSMEPPGVLRDFAPLCDPALANLPRKQTQIAAFDGQRPSQNAPGKRSRNDEVPPAAPMSPPLPGAPDTLKLSSMKKPHVAGDADHMAVEALLTLVQTNTKP